MLIKITESCHGACSHCMNNAVPCDRHMTIKRFTEVIEFCLRYDVAMLGDTITGGEPSENPCFDEFIHTYYQMRPLSTPLCITTNGHWIVERPDEAHDMLERYPYLTYQVTYDSKYYPNKLDITKRALRHNRIVIITDVGKIYPQGRAVTNNLKRDANCPKCFNVMLMMMQSNGTLSGMLYALRLKAQKFCIPAIHYDGGIGLGESDLCPMFCSIYDSEQDIIDTILHHNCNGCYEALESFKKNGVNHLLRC